MKALAFNRHASTEGETKCINYITKELNKDDINPEIERFEWANIFTIALKLIFTFLFAYIFIYQIIMLFPNITWIILMLDILFFVIVFFVVKFLFDSTQLRFIGKNKEAKNLILSFQCKDPIPKRPVIIFSAHHDTASQRYPMIVIKTLYKYGVLLILTFLILTFIISIWSLLAIFSIAQINTIYYNFRNIIFAIGLIILVLNLILLANKKSDKSIGSIDNASGVAVLIELARLIKKNPLNKTDVIFLWCGAEERGLWGSKQYCYKHFEELNHNYNMEKSYNINIDMVGTYIGLLDKLGLFKKRNLNQNLNDVLLASASQQKIILKKESVKIGSGSSDHQVFRAYARKYENKGFQVSLFSTEDDVKYIHSKQDTPEKCSAENLNNCIEICYNAVKSLDLRVE